jgi:hypothetical protein
MKKILTLISLLTLMLVGAKQPIALVELTIINKSEMDIAIQLKGQDKVCANKCDTIKGEFYYLSVPEGSREIPYRKTFEIEKDTYGMQLFFIQTYDPVYGFKCPTPAPNLLVARRNIRLVVLPCDEYPNAVGEPSMWKYLPYPLDSPNYFNLYWKSRLVY